MADLRSSIQSFHVCFEVVENVVLPILSVQENHQKAIADHNAQVPSLWSHIDDLEDRHHQNNIHIRGMPEVIQQEDLLPTVTSIIKTLLRNGPNCH